MVKNIAGTETWQEVFHAGQQDYEWNEFQTWYDRATGRWYWIADSGCCCDALLYYVNRVEHFENGRYMDLLNAFRTYAAENRRAFPPHEVSRATKELRQFKKSL